MSAGNDDLDLDMELAMAGSYSQQQRGELIHAFPIQTTEIEERATTPTLVDGPGFGSGIAMNRDGDYLVVDNESHSVKAFDKQGKFKFVFGESQLTSPWDIFITNSGKVVVSDTPCGDVKVFSHSGKFLKSSEFGFHLQDLYGICYHKYSKELAVCDKTSSCVYIHDPAGVVTDIINTTSKSERCADTKDNDDDGDDDGDKPVTMATDGPKMLMPAYVTFDKYRNLYISDAEAHALFAFDIEGNLKFTYGGEEGQDDGQLKHPAGVCVDAEGNILLADSGNCRVVVLDPWGEFLSYAFTWEDGLAEPQALLVDEDRLVVTEGSTGLVKVYEYSGPLNLSLDCET